MIFTIKIRDERRLSGRSLALIAQGIGMRGTWLLSSGSQVVWHKQNELSRKLESILLYYVAGAKGS